MAYGVTADGFVIKPYSVIIQEKKDKAKAEFGADVDLTPTSPLMKFIEVTTLEEVLLWEMAEALYYSAYLDTATGDSLDKVVRILGVSRKTATNATGQVTFSGTDGTVVPTGTSVETETGIVFLTTEDGTIASGTVTVDVEALNAGISGNVASGSIVVITSPIAGVTSVTNASATTGGTDVETDTALRLRTLDALDLAGKATLDALKAAVLAVDGVTNVLVTENVATHVVTIYVQGLSSPNTDVDDAILDTRSAGIQVLWQNPTTVDIYIDTTVDVTANAPGDAATQIENKILEYVNGLDIGDDVVYVKLYDIIYNEFSWVYDVTILLLDTVTPPTGTSNIAIAANQIAITEAGKIGVTLV